MLSEEAMTFTSKLGERTDADLVAPNLYVGSKPAFGSYNVAAIVLCAKEFQPRSTNFPGPLIIHAPFDDNGARALTRDEETMILGAVQIVVGLLQSNRPVLVTCAMGLNRSGLVAALAMRLAYGYAPEDVIIRLRRARGPWALSNGIFEKFVRTYSPKAAKARARA